MFALIRNPHSDFDREKRNISTKDTFVKLEDIPPACVECRHYKYDEGSRCTRQSVVQILNVITGEYQEFKKDTSVRCQYERYGVNESQCQIQGRFFEPICEKASV